MNTEVWLVERITWILLYAFSIQTCSWLELPCCASLAIAFGNAFDCIIIFPFGMHYTTVLQLVDHIRRLFTEDEIARADDDLISEVKTIISRGYLILGMQGVRTITPDKFDAFRRWSQ